MKNMGIFNPNWNPIRPGGLTPHEIAYLKRQGWKEGRTKANVEEAPIGFAAPEIPGGFTLHNFGVVKGTRFLYNTTDERAILVDCGNPTCWRYLLRQPPRKSTKV